MLTDLTEIEEFCSVNLGGICRVRYIAAENIIRIPEPVAHVVSDPIEILNGTDFLEINFANARFSENLRRNVSGEAYPKTLEIVVAKDRETVGYLTNKLRGIPVVLVIQDNNDLPKIIGSKECPMMLESQFESGTKPTDVNARTLRFSGITPHESYYYHLPVEDVAITVLGDPGGLFIADPDGNLISEPNPNP